MENTQKPELGHGTQSVDQGTSDQQQNPPLKTVDWSAESLRHTVVVQGTATVYQGHPTTLLMPDGRTIYCVWTFDHGGPCGPLKRSDDGGLSWGDLLDVPENWQQVKNCPTLFRLPDPQGHFRLFIYAGQGPDGCIHVSHSDDDGKTWSPMQTTGLVAVMPFCTIMPIDGGKRLLALTNTRRFDGEDGEPTDKWSNIIGQSISEDGGFTWSPWRTVADDPELKLCEPWIVTPPPGTAGPWVCLLRENRYGRSYGMTSSDEGATWSKAKPLPEPLAGDRHIARYAPDGRLVVVFRDRSSVFGTQGHFVGWVGHYEDLLNDGMGCCRIKLLHSHAGSDCGYPGLEVLPDGTFVATTYIKYRAGEEKHSVVATRFKLDEL